MIFSQIQVLIFHRIQYLYNFKPWIMCNVHMELDMFLNWGQRSLILKNSAKIRITSFEIQRTRHKPRFKESLTWKNRKKFLSIGIKGSLKNKDSNKTSSSQGFCFWWSFKRKLNQFWLYVIEQSGFFWKPIILATFSKHSLHMTNSTFFFLKIFSLCPIFPPNKPLEICNPFFLFANWFAPWKNY